MTSPIGSPLQVFLEDAHSSRAAFAFSVILSLVILAQARCLRTACRTEQHWHTTEICRQGADSAAQHVMHSVTTA